jgi:hypothetical protein
VSKPYEHMCLTCWTNLQLEKPVVLVHGPLGSTEASPFMWELYARADTTEPVEVS